MEQIISGDKAKMPMTERFYSVNGQMMGYESGGVKKDFLTDHLGSITAEIDQTQTRTYDTRYSAYGRNNWSTGTGCGFGWVGSYGYRETGLFHMSHYVRARHYSYVTGNWSTVDPLWPDESAYGYVRGWAIRYRDPSGMQGSPVLVLPWDKLLKQQPKCPPWVVDGATSVRDKFCASVSGGKLTKRQFEDLIACAKSELPSECKQYDPKVKMQAFNSCLLQFCLGFDPKDPLSLACPGPEDKKCTSDKCAYTECFPTLTGKGVFQGMTICPSVTGCKTPDKLPKPCNPGDSAYGIPKYDGKGLPNLTQVIIHELMHSCAVCPPKPAFKGCDESFAQALTKCLIKGIPRK